MRFPPFSELDRDQRNIYSQTPSHGSVLITGPPGTGKTVIAMHRAFKLAASGTPVKVIMFNKVLRQYTANFDGLPKNVLVDHLHSWAPKWYFDAFGKSIPKISHFVFDWYKISIEIRDCSTSSVLQKLNWGHLIIDEGQDFSPEMYKCFMRVIRHKGLKGSKSAPSISVFADDNQTINNTNSSISDLIEELNCSIKQKRLWRLVKNYRNSSEIASFSRYFQVRGAGAAQLPQYENGMKPTVFLFEESSKDIKQIVNFVTNAGVKEVGVIVFGSKYDVKRTFSSINSHVTDQKLSCHVQTYSSGNNSNKSEKSLLFDQPPSITILHAQSTKGLEFDVVFMINFQALLAYDASEIDNFKKLYVMSSRARSNLFVFIKASADGGLPPAARLLPKPSEGLCEYVCVESWAQQMARVLNDVDWLGSAALYQRAKVKHNGILSTLRELDKKKRIAVLENVAKSCYESNVLISIINDDLNWGSDDDLTDIIVELGLSKVLSFIDGDIK